MSGRIVVDTNAGENDMHDRLLKKFGAEVVSRARLDVGDVHLVHPEHGNVVIERKGWNDLAASLTDGRYAEQKARQMAAAADGNTTVVYLVQGQLPGWFASFPGGNAQMQRAGACGRIESAVISTAVGDGIPVLRALDCESVAEHVATLYQKLHTGMLDGARRAQSKTAAGYAGLVHVKKASNTDAASTWVSMLATVRGMSAARAKLVAERYPCARSLVDEVTATDAKGAIKRLADLQVGENKRLGPALAKKLVEIFGK